ncbi:MAG: RluA family pseudouridine synthase [Planctomycetota bacterium]
MPHPGRNLTRALPELVVLYEDNHLIAVNKPAGMLIQGDKTGDESLLERTREWIRVKCRKPGRVYCGLVHRLDRPASGVVLFARTSKAASRLCEAFKRHEAVKLYRAVVHGRPPEREGRLSHLLVPGKEGRKTRVAQGAVKAQEAVLFYRTLASTKSYGELEVCLETGRKHQIRAQLAHIGCPIVGDLKYGSNQPLFDGRAIALHALRLEVKHPTREETVSIEAPLPLYWPRV